MTLRLFQGPLVDPHQVRKRKVTPTDVHRPAEVFDFVTRGTKRNETCEPLNPRFFVVVPDFMAFNRMLATLAPAHFALVSGCGVGRPAKAVPLPLWQAGPQIVIPSGCGYEVEGQLHRPAADYGAWMFIGISELRTASSSSGTQLRRR